MDPNNISQHRVGYFSNLRDDTNSIQKNYIYRESTEVSLNFNTTEFKCVAISSAAPG